jgi:hypothetical protein
VDGVELALDAQQRPHVLAAVASYPFGGALARRSGPGPWEVQPLPEGWFNPSFTLSAEGTPLVTRIEEPWMRSPLTLWEQRSGTWQSKATIGPELRAWVGLSALRRDAQGRLHALLASDEAFPRLVYARESGGWNLQPLNIGGRVLVHPGFALSPRGEAHFAYWEEVEGRWTLTWQGSSSPAERVHALDCCGGPERWPVGGTETTPIRMALTNDGSADAPERRHLLFVRPSSKTSGMSELAYATREAQGLWEISTLFEDQRLKACGDTPPRGPGDTCEGEFITHRPLEFVSTNQEVRVLTAWTHVRYALSARCVRGQCDWSGNGATEESRLELAWVEAGRAQTVTLWQGAGALGIAAAQADAQGRIHLVSHRGSEWVYLLIATP